MTLRSLALAIGGLFLLSAGASAQTAVQLPTFNFFTTSTTVTVPDQGNTLMGSVNRSSSGNTTRGVPILGKIPGLNRGFKNTGIGSSTSASQMRVSATIIDLNELDEAVLAEAAARRMARGEALGGERFAGGGGSFDPALERRADFLSRHIGRGPPEAVAEAPKREAPSPEEIRRKNEAAKEARDAEAVAYFNKAEAAVADGKPGVAKIYYGMAAKRATGEFKEQVAARLSALTSGLGGKLAAGGM